MNNIQFITAIHGGEYMPVLALASFGIDQIVANPNALKAGKRFVEKDLNASFASAGKTYEEKRARQILRQIEKDKLVIDLHTFSAKSEPFIVIVNLKMLDFAKKIGFKHIVFMNHNIKKGHSLIDARDGVSVELGNHDDPKTFEEALKLTKRIKNKKPSKIKYRVYEVYGIIENKRKYENFKLYKSKDESFYPVLAGEKAYYFYGLKARILKDL